MSKENLSPEGSPEPIEVETRVQLKSLDENVNIADATSLRLEVEGPAQLVGAAFELVIGLVQMTGGVVERAVGENGEDLTNQFRPAVVDPLDFGDTPVA